jgi:uncharacterized protein (UPF0548 family)
VRLLGIDAGVPSRSELDRRLEDARESPLTYEFVGATLSTPEQARPSETRRDLSLGSGEAVFERAAEALRLWLPQRNLGGFVHPAEAPIVVGTTLLVVLKVGPVAVVIPNRIVEVVDDADRFGFAYGTLEGHAERGEESFLVERRPSGEVCCTIRVDARPATTPARLAAPAVSWIQRWALGRYLEAVRRHATAA